jgi:hypothetical protein
MLKPRLVMAVIQCANITTGHMLWQFISIFLALVYQTRSQNRLVDSHDSDLLAQVGLESQWLTPF